MEPETNESLEEVAGAAGSDETEDGIFTSATDYIRDAPKYAQGTESNGTQKEITAVDVRPSTPDDDDYVSGEFPIDAYIKFCEILVPIKGIAYTDVPIARGKEDFVIEMRGNATILIKSDKLGVNKLITDVDLKNAIQNML